MHSGAVIVLHALIMQALAMDSTDTLAHKLVDKLIDRVTSAQMNLTDLDDATLAKTSMGTSLGKASASNPVMFRAVNPALSTPLSRYWGSIPTSYQVKPVFSLGEATEESPSERPSFKEFSAGQRSGMIAADSPAPEGLSMDLERKRAMAIQKAKEEEEMLRLEWEKREEQKKEKSLKLWRVDTGSPKAQIIIATKRVAQLTEHLKEQPRDNSAKRGLRMILNQRAKNLKYFKRKNGLAEYADLTSELGIRGR